MSAILLLVVRILIAAGLYAFLAWAFWTLYQDLLYQSRTLSLQALPKLSLWVSNEPAPRTYQQLEINIGRNASCDLCLADTTVSGRHARILYRQGQWWLEDLDSTNGTYLNQIRLNEPMVLTVGDEIRCGQVRLDIENLS
ncbi:MAG: FHA-domain-containing protein [Anaerolineae bacterium]|nr:MAG: FHA-domain-containing protein [Anaerolineae bacterium]